MKTLKKIAVLAVAGFYGLFGLKQVEYACEFDGH